MNKFLTLKKLKNVFLFLRLIEILHYLCHGNIRKAEAGVNLLALVMPENLKNCMLYVTLPDEMTRKVSFYLAMEEYVARNVRGGDCLFYWQVEPSVIFGRNQVIANEVDTAYCREHGVSLFRRKSGGGCVYADMGNVMFSYVTGGGSVGFTFNRYIMMMVLMLRRMGVRADATGRNDIVVDGRKVSGNAFYRLLGRDIVHGTMLYDTDMDNMAHAITPAAEKLAAGGVASVRARVGLLKDYMEIGIDDFKARARRDLCDGERALTAADVAAIEEIERTVYLSRDFIYGKDPRHTVVRRRRIDGVGGLEARIDVRGGVVRGVSLGGDYFATGDVDALMRSLVGVRMEREAVAAALPERVDDVVMGLRKDDLVSLLADEMS